MQPNGTITNPGNLNVSGNMGVSGTMNVSTKLTVGNMDIVSAIQSLQSTVNGIPSTYATNTSLTNLSNNAVMKNTPMNIQSTYPWNGDASWQYLSHCPACNTGPNAVVRAGSSIASHISQFKFT